MSHPVVERNENIFPNPTAFIPERWIDTGDQDLEKWLIPFSKGRRQCIAMKYVIMRSTYSRKDS